ncbi:dihydropteroate synthase [Comamonas flocculans]|uniref:Dihydropteroate synthase n=1 Tax=Comamonas flocculans TaxID=2597701 RepID=A0A5B8RSR1_9BURK|nr:dihydropteroate synthase [Comamonas flocculans]QEA11752.1 dihydropteroate synthase [Comamonas flocculans]
MYWQTTRFAIDLAQPRVMGIVNVTPDSFSDGGEHASAEAAIAHCEQLVAEGADLLDIGGESTRPGSPPLPLEEELARVLPVVRAALTLGVPVSVDTYKPQVMQRVLDLGVDIVNDIWALRQPGAAQVVAAHPSCGVCLMHMHGEPQTMQLAPMQGDALVQVLSFLQHAAQALQGLGVEKHRIAIDPGIGFGKTVEQNFTLLAGQRVLQAAGYPLLVGWSRKSSLGAVTGLAARERVAASAVAAVLAVQRGAAVVRVHDVKETVAALSVLRAAQAGDAAGQA